MAFAPTCGALCPQRALSLILVALVWTAAGSTPETVAGSPEATASSTVEGTSSSAAGAAAGTAEEKPASSSLASAGAPSAKAAEAPAAPAPRAATTPSARRASATATARPRSLSTGSEASGEKISTTLEEGGPTLTELLEKLEHASDLGVATSEDKKARLRATADLTLLVEVLSLAGDSFTNMAGSVKTELKPRVVDSENIKLALRNAGQACKLAGLPQKEIDAAEGAVHKELTRLLTMAITLTKTNGTVVNMMNLCHQISLSLGLELPDIELIQQAQSTFTQRLQGTFTKEDMPFLEQVVNCAELAQAEVPRYLRHWVEVMPMLRNVGELPEDDMESLPLFTKAVRDARARKLPVGLPELQKVAAKAQHCVMLNVKQAMGSQDRRLVDSVATNSTSSSARRLQQTDCNVEYLGKLLGKIADAEEHEVSSANLTHEKVLKEAKALATDCALALLEQLHTHVRDTSHVQSAFRFAVAAGVAQKDIDDARARVKTATEASLTAALADFTAGSLTASEVEELARAINCIDNYKDAEWNSLVNQTPAETGRVAYKARLEGPHNVTNGPACFMALVENADLAGLSVNSTIRAQHAALLHAEEAATFPQCTPTYHESLMDTVRYCDELTASGVPDYSVVVSLRALARNCAWHKLNATNCADKGEVEANIVTVRTAERMGVPDTATAPARSQCLSVTKESLEALLRADDVDADEVNYGIQKVQNAGGSDSYIKGVKDQMVNISRTRLTIAITNAKGPADELSRRLQRSLSSTSPSKEPMASNFSARRLQQDKDIEIAEKVVQLGKACFFACRLEYVCQALGPLIAEGKEAYKQILSLACVVPMAVELLEVLVVYADWAEVSVQQCASQRAGTARKMRNKVTEIQQAMPEGSTDDLSRRLRSLSSANPSKDLAEIMSLISEGNDLQNEDLEKLKSFAVEESRLELDELLADAKLQKLHEAVDSALLVGVNEKSLLSGTSVLEALGGTAP